MPPTRPARTALAAELAALCLGLAVIGLLTAFFSLWIRVSKPTIVALSFLLVVLVAATMSTLRAAVVISLLAFLCFNYFFLPPVGTWTITDPENWVALFTLLAVSLIASHLSSQARLRAREATARRDELARLFDLTRDVLLTTDSEEAMALIARAIALRFGLRAVSICLPGTDGWQVHDSGTRSIGRDQQPLDRAIAAAPAPPDAGEPTGSGHTLVESPDGTTVWLVPLRVGTRPIGLLALEGGDVEPGTRDAIAGVTAIAIERSQLLEERREAEAVRRGADLKAALLASLGHDLKTPLTAVTVAANNLDASWLTEEQRQEQAGIVRTELGRLNRLFEEIVDMARIETNAVEAEREWVQPAEIIEAGARQAEPALAAHRLEVVPDADKVLVRLDPRLTSAALAHLLENAGQYSPLGSTISVSTTVSSGELRIAVRDRGVGIAVHELDRLFERFYRGVDARHQRFGTGMGLAITRGLLAAEGGRVWAENHPLGGAVFTIAVPVDSRAADALGDAS